MITYVNYDIKYYNNIYSLIIKKLNNKNIKLQKESEIETEINISQNENLLILKEKNKNNFFVSIGSQTEFYLGKTTFQIKEKNILFIPKCKAQVGIFLDSLKSSYIFNCENKNLNKQEIFEICSKGEDKIINLIISHFEIEFNERLFILKNIKLSF